MIFQVRPNVFETNSSSTHSLNICTEEEFDNWKNDPNICFIGDAWGDFHPKNFDGRKFVTQEEINQRAKEANEKDERNDYPEDMFAPTDEWYGTAAQENDIKTYEMWREPEYLDIYSEHFTTPSGDRMVAFGEYGTNY